MIYQAVVELEEKNEEPQWQQNAPCGTYEGLVEAGRVWRWFRFGLPSDPPAEPPSGPAKTGHHGYRRPKGQEEEHQRVHTPSPPFRQVFEASLDFRHDFTRTWKAMT